jgi:hypothetical protein
METQFMKLCPELPPPELLQYIQKFAKDQRKFEEGYYAEGECWDASMKFVKYASDNLRNLMELKVVCIGDHPHYKKYCSDKADHWVVAAGEWRIDFTARQFHNWFAFPRVWKEKPEQPGKKTNDEKAPVTTSFAIPVHNQLYR